MNAADAAAEANDNRTRNRLPERVPLQRFPSAFRLKRRKLIGDLFSSSPKRRPEASASLSVTRTTRRGAVRVLYRLTDRESSGSPAPYQIAFSAPRSKFRRAVDRNRLKRLMRVSFQQIKVRFDSLNIPPDRAINMMVLIRRQGGSVEETIGADTVMALATVAEDIESWFPPDHDT